MVTIATLSFVVVVEVLVWSDCFEYTDPGRDKLCILPVRIRSLLGGCGF